MAIFRILLLAWHWGAGIRHFGDGDTTPLDLACYSEILRLYSSPFGQCRWFFSPLGTALLLRDEFFNCAAPVLDWFGGNLDGLATTMPPHLLALDSFKNYTSLLYLFGDLAIFFFAMLYCLLTAYPVFLDFGVRRVAAMPLLNLVGFLNLLHLIFQLHTYLPLFYGINTTLWIA